MSCSKSLSVIENVLSVCSDVQPTDNAVVFRNSVGWGNSALNLGSYSEGKKPLLSYIKWNRRDYKWDANKSPFEILCYHSVWYCANYSCGEIQPCAGNQFKSMYCLRVLKRRLKWALSGPCAAFDVKSLLWFPVQVQLALVIKFLSQCACVVISLQMLTG